MSLRVTKKSEGLFEVELAEPEKTWVSKIGDVIEQPDVGVISSALGSGLIDLVSRFVTHNETTETPGSIA